ncbi:hypothetical protein V6N13_051247 [Hibiscus sabdariffa]
MRKECTKPNDVGLQMETWVQVAGGPIRLNTEVGQMPVGFDSRALAERWWTTDPIGWTGLVSTTLVCPAGASMEHGDVALLEDTNPGAELFVEGSSWLGSTWDPGCTSWLGSRDYGC